MRNSELLLFFFIIYDVIITYIMLYGYYEIKDIIDSKDKYIQELICERDKIKLEKNQK